MKVIRLVEDDIIAQTDAKQAENQASTQVDNVVNALNVRKIFNNIGKDYSIDDAYNALHSLLTKVGSYGSNTAANIVNVFDTFKRDKFKVLKYFLDILGYENLTDHNNVILSGFAHKQAPELIHGDKTIFTKFYNTLNDSSIGIKSNYFSDASDQLIFNPVVYSIKDNQRKALIKKDTTANKTWREQANAHLSHNTYDVLLRDLEVEPEKEEPSAVKPDAQSVIKAFKDLNKTGKQQVMKELKLTQEVKK